MGRRNIYVSPGREGLYREAALLAGSLSAAVDQGLELYVARARSGTTIASEVHVVVGRGRNRRRTRFRGRVVDEFRVTSRHPDRIDGATVYLTAGGRLAAWRWSDPDWAAFRTRARDAWHLDDPVDATDDGWDDWFERRGEEFIVADDPDELAALVGLDDESVARIRLVFTPVPTDVVDI